MHERTTPGKNVVLALSLLGASWLAPSSVAAQNVAATKFVLDNGLQVIFHVDRSLPIATVNLWYYVGSKDEPKGRSGFAHLFEHLMFMGTKRVPGNRFDEIMEKGGGANNASTSSDRTNYYSWGPSELLPVLLWLEADRMEDFGKALSQDKLDKQREVVRNERRQTTEMRPYGVADEVQGELFYAPSHGYHKSVIGSHEDLEAATLDDVKNFFATYYVPNNASLVVAGDFDPKETRALVEQLFSSLPRAPIVPRREHRDSELLGTQSWTGYDQVQFPRVTTLWKTVKIYAPFDAELDIAAGILAGSKSSRLYKRLVVEEKLAVDVSAYQWSRVLGGQFHLQVLARPDANLGRIEAIVDLELSKLAKEGPTEEEVARQKSTIEASFVSGLESLRDRADRLNAYNFHLGTPDGFARDLERYRKASTASVREAVARFLARDDRLVQTVLPLEKAVVGSRDSMPVPAPTKDFRFESPRTFELDGGIPVRHFERRQLPLVRVALQVRRGTLVDGKAKAGRSYLMAKMLAEGAGTRDAFEFSEALEAIGASLRTTATREVVRVEIQALSSKIEAAIDLWRDALLAPRFAQEDWERVRRLHLDALARRADDPNQVARQVASTVYFGADHPFGQSVDGSKESVANLTREDLVAAHAGLIRPELASVYIAGDIDEARARALLTRALTAWRPKGDALVMPDVAPVEPQHQRVYLVHRPDAAQTVVRFVMPGPARDDPARLEFEAINTILGGSFTSRLNANIREKNGYSYGAGSSYAMWKELGIFVASASVQAQVTGPALREFLHEFEKLRGADISVEEAAKAKSTQRQELVASLAGLDGLLTTAMDLEAEGLGFDELERRMQGFAAIEAAALNGIAKRSVTLEAASLLLVGDRAVILAQLDGLPLPAPVEVDVHGRPIAPK